MYCVFRCIEQLSLAVIQNFYPMNSQAFDLTSYFYIDIVIHASRHLLNTCCKLLSSSILGSKDLGHDHEIHSRVITRKSLPPVSFPL